jgi:hypothetical protein
MEHIVDGVVQVKPPGVAVAVYVSTGLPPLSIGGDHETITLESPP